MNLDKDSFRNNIFAFRKNLCNELYEEKSQIIFNKLINNKWYLEADTIISYVSINNEVDTYGIINKAFSDRKKVAVPKITDKKMDFYFIKSLRELKKGYFNIPEPINTSNICIPDNINSGKMLMIVPGVAFDINNNRLGYGGGFYDKYLCKYKMNTIAICFKEQIFDKLPIDEHDIKMDLIISDI